MYYSLKAGLTSSGRKSARDPILEFSPLMGLINPVEAWLGTSAGTCSRSFNPQQGSCLWTLWRVAVGHSTLVTGDVGALLESFRDAGVVATSGRTPTTKRSARAASFTPGRRV